MRLTVFEFIDEVIEEIEENRAEINDCAEEIRLYFRHVYKNDPALLSINKRIKTNESISEKILRQNFFLKYKTAEEVIENMSDIIGIRIQCRFTKDEEELFEFLKTYFAIESTDYEGYFYNPRNSKVLLNFSDKQPQLQQNGFAIYRIDGKILGNKYNYNFEVQIKSFVNVFWGDIEHDILYKNFSYMITEDFLREMLYSIKRNLEQVDAQLLVVYQYLSQLEANEEEVNVQQLKKMVSKLIHDIFSVGFKDSTGVLLDFRASADLIVDYLFAKVQYNQDVDITDYFTSIMKKLANIKSNEFRYGVLLGIDDMSSLVSEHGKVLGSGIESIMNVDLKWNLILSIIFELEGGNKNEEFSNFIDYLVFKISDRIDVALDDYRIDPCAREKIKNSLMDITMGFVFEYYDSDFFTDKNMELVRESTCQLIERSLINCKHISDAKLDYDWYYNKLELEAEF